MAKQLEKRVIANNRRAKFDYFIEDTLEVGIVLQGTEVKSLRMSEVNINDAYVDIENNELVLINSFIPEYSKAFAFNHMPRRTRKLLAHRRQIKKLHGLLKMKGKTMVPLSIYFNERNRVKLEIAVVTGKKEHDKRESIKQNEWKRDKARMLKN